ncbi:MAG TPA: ABC transporter permease [Ktedonobacteraceae bacterium]
MKLLIRSIRNVLRSPLRLVLVVALLGTSLMFVAAMMSLSASAQQELAAVHQQVGTAITINYASNDSVNSTSGNGGSQGGVTISGPKNATLIPNSTVQKVKSTRGVVSTQESLTRPDTDGKLKSGSITDPNGKQISIPVLVNGISSDASHFTLQGGTTPTLVSGRSFHDYDANAYVAMMSQSLANRNHLKVGSTFTLKGKTFRIIGLYTTSDQFSSNSIVVPLATMQKVFGIKGVDSITAYAANYEQVKAVATRLRNALGKQYDVVTQDAQYNNVFSALGATQNTIQLALIISVSIAVVVIIFAVLMLVRERTVEIGILKAIGASHLQVLRQFWTEIVTLSAAAAALAALLLATLGPTISQRFDISPSSPGASGGPVTTGGPGGQIFQTPPNANLGNIHLAAATLNAQTLLIILGLGIGLALLTSVIPTWFVSHIKPAEVLRKAN